MKTKIIKQIIMFKASPHEIYECLIDEKKHGKFTGSKCKINRKINGKFNLYDGYINGENINLIQDKKIVQSWTCSDFNKNYYSKVSFEFKKIKNGTKLIFTHSNVPAKEYDNLKQGWNDFYWKPMKLFLEKQKSL